MANFEERNSHPRLVTTSGSVSEFAEAGEGNIAGGVGGYVTIGSGLGGPG